MSEDQLRVATSLVNNRDMTKALNLRNSTNNIIAQFTTDRDIDNDWKKQINHLLIQLPGNRKTLNFKNIAAIPAGLGGWMMQRIQNLYIHMIGHPIYNPKYTTAPTQILIRRAPNVPRQARNFLCHITAR